MIFLTFLLAGLCGGTTGALIKYLTQDLDPALVVFIRLGLAVMFFLPFVFKNKIDIPQKYWKQTFLSSILLFSNILLFSIGVRHSSAIMSSLIYVPTSLVVAFLGYLLLREKLSTNQLIGLLITIVGMSILLSGSLATKDIKSFGEPSGNFLIVIGLFVWSFYFITSRKLVSEISPLSVSFVNTLIAFCISIFIILPSITPNAFSFKTPQILAFIASAITSVAFLFLSQTLLKKTSAFSGSLVTYIGPVAATGWGIVLFSEKPTIGLLIGALVTFIGVFIATSFNYIKAKTN